MKFGITLRIVVEAKDFEEANKKALEHKNQEEEIEEIEELVD